MLLSIIIPAYNAESTIIRCLESLIAQTLTDYEIIVVNDGSSDKTGFIIDNYSQRYRNIKTIHRKNGGQSQARNSGIKTAQGKYIAFVDADDMIEFPDLYARNLLYLLNNPNVDVLQFPTKWLYFNQERFSDRIDKIINNTDAIRNSFLKGELKGMPCNKIFKRDLFEKVLFSPNRYFEDTWLMMDLLPYLNEVAFTSYGYYTYVIREGSEMTSKFSLIKYINLTETCLRGLNLFLNEDRASLLYLNLYFGTVSAVSKGIQNYGFNHFADLIQRIKELRPSYNVVFKYAPDIKHIIKYFTIRILGFKLYSTFYSFKYK